MNKTTLVSSPSIDNSSKQIGDFKNHTRGIGRNIPRKMGYARQGIGKRSQ
jgi:hypothetical protein